MALLTGIRVLDFGRFIAGPYCAALLGDLGADVIRIERVQGGEDRGLPPVADTGDGGLFLQMNRNKRGLTLDVAHEAGQRIVRQLVAGADVVVANLPPATLRQLGLDYATLEALNPRIVLACASAFGPGGPYSDRPGFDSVGQAMCGAVYLSGQPEAPVRTAAPYVDVSTAQALAMGTLAALWAREKSGRGQRVEGSLLRGALLAAWARQRPRAQALDELAAARIPAAPVLSPQQALDDAHIRAAGLLVPRPVNGSAQTAPIAPHPVQMSHDEPVFARSAPSLGQHTGQILAELGYDADAVAALRAQRAV